MTMNTELPLEAAYSLHGGDIYSARVRCDFSANINPLGMPEAARQALAACAEAAEHYPDPQCRELTALLAERECVDPEKIVCGNGAADLIYRLARVLHPCHAVLPVPSFGDYEKALREERCDITFIPYPETEGFRLTDTMLRQTEDLLPQSGTSVLFLCIPNNPTGMLPEAAMLNRVRNLCRENKILIVLDACFLDFADADQRVYIGDLSDNEILLKAFTKIYAMPGLRLGYCVCGSANLAGELRTNGPCWSVSVPAQLCGAAVLRDTGDYSERTRALVRQERGFLQKGLAALGLRVLPADANFLLWHGSIGLREKLLSQGINIRDCANFRGLEPGWYRTAVRTHEENEALLEALKAVLTSHNALK